MSITRKFLIIFPISQAIAHASVALAAMPTAGLPIEPATSDKDLFDESYKTVGQPASVTTSQNASQVGTQSLQARTPGNLGEFGTVLRMQMSKDGFGAQLKGIQYAEPWLGVTEALRYFSSETDEQLFEKRYGILLGLDAHPWRQSFISPFFQFQVGWERFTREDSQEPLDSPVVEAAAGVEMSLGRYASLSGQWTENYYSDLKEPLYAAQKAKNDKDFKRRAVAEVFFNLRWNY